MTVVPFPTRTPAPVTFEGEDGWRLLGNCLDTDPESFYADDSATTTVAKRVCAACTVRVLCLDATLRTEAGSGERPFGVSGGMTATQRRKLTHAEVDEIRREADRIRAAASPRRAAAAA